MQPLLTFCGFSLVTLVTDIFLDGIRPTNEHSSQNGNDEYSYPISYAVIAMACWIWLISLYRAIRERIKPKPNPAQPDPSTDNLPSQKPRGWLKEWLKPYLTSRERASLTLLTFLSMTGLVAFDGCRALKTLWRIGFLIFSHRPDSAAPHGVKEIAFYTFIIIMVLDWLYSLLVFGVVLLFHSSTTVFIFFVAMRRWRSRGFKPADQSLLDTPGHSLKPMNKQTEPDELV